MTHGTSRDPLLRAAAGPDEIAAAARIRHEVFAREQGLFEGTDRDSRDDDAQTLHLVALVEGDVVGTVRIYPLDHDGTWLGDRLAVAEPYRVFHLGVGLVRLAVETAGRLGGTVMHAHIQLPNVTYFRRLGWRLSGPTEEYCGAIHQPMSIDLREAP
ncbi:MAG: MSMEG_0567/Sll0786 family nitrogen starvation N-acetyltransferase [Candidatus Nanopelagicales bacterium]